MNERRNRPLVTDEEVEEALHFLIERADEFGAAEADAELAEHMVKATRAEIIAQSRGTSADRREAEALTHPRYHEALEARRAAFMKVRTMLARRRGYEVRIEVWRTLSANNRGARP